mmetsp:Transcript_16501/g.23125  ORF Transcript_16501/g.23125 Transcript_16501/m.23125 type:complete len:116 (-) Transcript_16501:8-355(-)
MSRKRLILSSRLYAIESSKTKLWQSQKRGGARRFRNQGVCKIVNAAETHTKTFSDSLIATLVLKTMIASDMEHWLISERGCICSLYTMWPQTTASACRCFHIAILFCVLTRVSSV